MVDNPCSLGSLTIPALQCSVCSVNQKLEDTISDEGRKIKYNWYRPASDGLNRSYPGNQAVGRAKATRRQSCKLYPKKRNG